MRAPTPQVYTTLAVTLLIAAAGVFTDVTFHVGGVLTGIASFVSLLALLMMAPTQQNLHKRLAALAAFAFCQVRRAGVLTHCF